MPLYRAELLAKKPLWHGALIHDVSQVLYLPFDYDDGSYARDRSGYNNHGTIYGATLADGKIGMARSFDGTDDYVQTNLDMSGQQVIAVSAWVRVTDATKIPAFVVAEVRTYYIRLPASATGEIWFGAYDAGGILRAVNFGVTVNEALNKDLFLCAIFDGKAGKSSAWLNAELKDELSFSPTRLYTPAVVDYVSIGGPDDYFAGIIDEPRIFNRAPSQAEIRMLMYRRF